MASYCPACWDSPTHSSWVKVLTSREATALRDQSLRRLGQPVPVRRARPQRLFASGRCPWCNDNAEATKPVPRSAWARELLDGLRNAKRTQAEQRVSAGRRRPWR